ncbi:MAG: BNR-4 repeat-containing protein [Pseudonocardia sp.]|nr:BNR-4 repeat-containing protein [Pseudonocardia sp.]
MPKRLGATVLLASLVAACSPGPSAPAPPPAEPGTVQLDPVTLSLLPGETATVYATKAGDPGFTGFAWRQDGLDVRPDGHAAEVTAKARPGSYDIVVDAGAGPDGTVHVTVRAPGQTADVDARQDVLSEGGAVRSARRPTTGGLYIPESQQTVISWMGEEGHPYIAAYDHTLGTWGQPTRVGTNPDPDYHNYPVLVETADGHLLAAYGAHDTPLRIARSEKPGTVEGDWTSTTVTAAPASSYPFPFRAADGRIFIFYRETLDRIDSQYLDDDRPLRYVVSADNGLTWRNSNELTDDFFALGSVDRIDNMDEIYVGQVRYLPATATRRERVLISWTLAGGGPDDNKHDRYHRNMYVSYFRPYDLHFESVAGKDLGTQLANDEMEADCKVLDTGEPRFAMDSDGFDTHDVDYVSVVDERADGKPVVMFTMFDGKNLITHYDVWTGTAWLDKTGDFGQPTDMELRGSVLQAYVSDPGQYESWVMTGDDETFEPGVVHRYNESKAGNRIETLIENYRQPLQFISGGRGFEGVSDASPELDVGTIGVP